MPEPASDWAKRKKPLVPAKPPGRLRRKLLVISVSGVGVAFLGFCVAFMVGFGSPAFYAFLAIGWLGVLSFLLCGVVGVVLFLRDLGRTAFLKTQIRLHELMLIVAAIGNAVGWSLRWLNDHLGGYDFDVRKALVGLGVLLLALYGVWIFGGAVWGLNAAMVLKRERSRDRLWLMFVGVLAVPAAIAGVVGVPAGLIGLIDVTGTSSGLTSLGIFLLGLIGLAFAWYAIKIHRRAGKT